MTSPESDPKMDLFNAIENEVYVLGRRGELLRFVLYEKDNGGDLDYEVFNQGIEDLIDHVKAFERRFLEEYLPLLNRATP